MGNMHAPPHAHLRHELHLAQVVREQLLLGQPRRLDARPVEVAEALDKDGVALRFFGRGGRGVVEEGKGCERHLKEDCRRRRRRHQHNAPHSTPLQINPK
jgi:hypothetical protein